MYKPLLDDIADPILKHAAGHTGHFAEISVEGAPPSMALFEVTRTRGWFQFVAQPTHKVAVPLAYLIRMMVVVIAVSL